MSEDDEDPFEEFEAPEDYEDDPFERLGDADPAEDAGGDPTDQSGDDAPAFEEEFIDESDPFATGSGQSLPGGDTASEGAEGGDDPFEPDDPFDGIEHRKDDPFGEGESVFESIDVDGLDADEVWESLDQEPSTPTVEDSRYVEVSKHRFCEQCEHFASPPNAHCTHEGAEIIEYLDVETVRLLNCPVVAEQRELENEE